MCTISNNFIVLFIPVMSLLAVSCGLSCGPPVGRIMSLAGPSVRPSVCPVQARNSKTKNVEKYKLV